MMRNIVFQAPRALGVALLFAACLAAGPRGAAAQDAATFIQNLGNEAIHVLGPSVPAAQRTAHFRRLFDSDFDLPGGARFVLGPNPRAPAPGQERTQAQPARSGSSSEPATVPSAPQPPDRCPRAKSAARGAC